MTSRSAALSNLRQDTTQAPSSFFCGESDSLPPLPAKFRLTPEFELMLECCAASSIFPAQIAAKRYTDINWESLVALSVRHQVLPLVQAALRQLGTNFIPEQVREKLKQCSMRARGRALQHGSELVRLNGAFREQGIGMMPLKGVTLSHRLFHDPTMRQVQDIDLMVRPEDLDRADRLLQALGYRRTFPAAELTPKMRRRMLLQEHHWSYLNDDLHLAVELHWSLDLWTPQNVAELWQQSHALDCCLGSTFVELNEDALLLLVCSHGAGHRWSRLKWLCDAAVLLSRERRGTWDDLLALAEQFDLKRALAQASLLSYWLLGTEPAQPLRELIRKEPSSAKLASQALQAMLMDSRRLHRLERFGLLMSLPYTLLLRPKLPVRVYMRRVWISSAYFSDFPLSDRWFWLYYPLRPLLWSRNMMRRSNPPRSRRPQAGSFGLATSKSKSSMSSVHCYSRGTGSMSEIVQCPVCRGSENARVDVFGEFSFLRCAQCTLEFCHPIEYDRANYDAAYKADGSSTFYVPSAQWLREASPALNEARWMLFAAQTEALAWLKANRGGASILDIGCGPGWFLIRARQLGFRVAGVEIGSEPVRLLRDRGYDVVCGSIESVPPQWSPQVVTVFEVLEHLPDPVQFLRQIRQRFPQALLILTVPSPRRWTKAGSHRDLADYPPNHLTRWNPASLTEALSLAGYSESEVRYSKPRPLELASVSVRGLWNSWTRKMPDRLTEVELGGSLRRLQKEIEVRKWKCVPGYLGASLFRLLGSSGISMLAIATAQSND